MKHFRITFGYRDGEILRLLEEMLFRKIIDELYYQTAKILRKNPKLVLILTYNKLIILLPSRWKKSTAYEIVSLSELNPKSNLITEKRGGESVRV
jgi:hypothetical protein